MINKKSELWKVISNINRLYWEEFSYTENKFYRVKKYTKAFDLSYNISHSLDQISDVILYEAI